MAVDSAVTEGLDRDCYMPEVLAFSDTAMSLGSDTERLKDLDECYTEMALALARDLYRGGGLDRMVSYDGVSGRYEAREEAFLVAGLAGVRSANDLRQWINSLLPQGREYFLLRDSLRLYRETAERISAHSLADGQVAFLNRGAARLAQAMNVYRWVHHYGFGQVIVVNIPSANLRYYTKDSLALAMKVVAGEPSKRTPRFAGWCEGLVLYPYWNVPHKIAIREILPLFKVTPDLAGSMALEIVDGKGRLINPAKIAWASYTPQNFPYRIRQAPGCFNALGVIKFNITSPFDVYMHDTNLKEAFKSAYRYYSHGCIRLEHPIELAMVLLKGRLDTTFLLSCLPDQRPIPVALEKPVPVFVVYSTVGMDAAGKLAWYRDIYHLKD